jgi:hypothetical protein
LYGYEPVWAAIVRYWYAIAVAAVPSGYLANMETMPAGIATGQPTCRRSTIKSAANGSPLANYASNSAACQTLANHCRQSPKWKHKKRYHDLRNHVQALETKANRRFRKEIDVRTFAYHL